MTRTEQARAWREKWAPGVNTKPGSIMRRALAALAGQHETTAEDFNRITQSVCDSKCQAINIRSEMQERGFLERPVRLTAKGLEAVALAAAEHRKTNGAAEA